MNVKSIKIWSFRVILALGFVNVAIFMWVDNEINKMWGAHTAVVDHKKYQTPQALIAIENINALSTDGVNMVANQTVLIDQGKIQSIGPDIRIPKNAIVVNGSGKYLIPGLIDSHVHIWQSPNDLLLYIANGVTHVRELSGTEEHLGWRQEIEEGRIGPRLFVASRRLNSSSTIKGWFDHWTAESSSISSPKHARKVLEAFSNEQYDAVKIYTFLSAQDFAAINQAANRVDIELLGHIPWTVELDQIWQSNLTELAHIEEIVKALNREFGGYDTDTSDEFLKFVQTRSQDIANNLAENNIAVVTTLRLMESFSKQRHELDQALSEVELEYVNPGITELSPLAAKVMGWLPDSNIYRINHDYSEAQLQNDKVYWEAYAAANQILLRAISQGGALVLAGTDANVPTAVPGFSMHDELQALVNAGMTSAQALRSATAIPANWMKVHSGKVAEGYIADLLVLDANPLQDIKHTRAIDSVITNGRLISRQTLNDMLEDVRNANAESRTFDISQYTD